MGHKRSRFDASDFAADLDRWEDDPFETYELDESDSVLPSAVKSRSSRSSEPDPADSEPTPPRPEPIQALVGEVVVDKRGRARQAGAHNDSTSQHSEFLDRLRVTCERDLYAFNKGILKMTLLTPTLHRGECLWLSKVPPRRKLWLMPRDHLKTSIAGLGMPLHIVIQPRENNIYFPGCFDKTCRYQRSLDPRSPDCTEISHRFLGRNTRIMCAYETATNASARLGWIDGQLCGNQIFRALWPECVWDNPRAQAREWNKERLFLPREIDAAQPTFDAVGVGGATTGRHYDAHIMDDVCTLEAANSPTVMASTIQWVIASRAMLDDPGYSLEWVYGTKWAVHDVYSEMMKNDPTIECRIRAVVESGIPIFPEVFSPEVIAEKQARFGKLFFLLYMNSAKNVELTDFDIADLRTFGYSQEGLCFEEDEHDLALAAQLNRPAYRPQPPARGMPLQNWLAAMPRDEYALLKYGNTRAW